MSRNGDDSEIDMSRSPFKKMYDDGPRVGVVLSLLAV